MRYFSRAFDYFLCSKACNHKAGNDKKKAGRQEAKQQELIAKIPSSRPYISIAEAVLLFNISCDTIYRLVRMGKISAVNIGERLTRICRTHIETMFASSETKGAFRYDFFVHSLVL
ncbi:MAG: helix-turn-helix domain-containing protein [Bacteroidales bacterium]|nr:helix-turn-helix domain-containing protein [Bacteroidales bacterium]